jgi:UDP-N-acetylmuramate dehydrogenase
VVAGAAALDVTVAEHAAAAGLEGMEFLSGIPGTIGGAVAMNAGAYGGDVAECLDWAEIVTRSGERVRRGGPRAGGAVRRLRARRRRHEVDHARRPVGAADAADG